MQGAWIQSLVGELRSHMPPCSVVKKKKRLQTALRNRQSKFKCFQRIKKMKQLTSCEQKPYHTTLYATSQAAQ